MGSVDTYGYITKRIRKTNLQNNENFSGKLSKKTDSLMLKLSLQKLEDFSLF